MKHLLSLCWFLFAAALLTAQFNETYAPVDFLLSPLFLGDEAVLGPDGDYYFLSNSVKSYNPEADEVKFSARFIECGGSQSEIRDICVLPDGRYYAAGTAFTPDSASCGAQLTFGGGSYDAILGYFSASGRMLWGSVNSEWQVQDSWQHLQPMQDGSVLALGNQFRNLRISQYDSTGNVRFDSIYDIRVEGFMATYTPDGTAHLLTEDYAYITFDPLTKAVTQQELVLSAGLDFDNIYTTGDMVSLPDGSLAASFTYQAGNPFLRSQRVLRFNRAGNVLQVYPKVGDAAISNEFARDIKLFGNELYVLGGIGDGVIGAFSVITLSALDLETFEPTFTDLYSGQQIAAYNLEAYTRSLDTILIHGGGGNATGTFNNFPFSNGQVGPIRMARCGVDANFGYSADGRSAAFTNFSSADAVDFEWDFGDGNTSFLNAPVHTYDRDGTYEVTLRSRTVNYCQQEKTMQITIPDGASSNTNVDRLSPKLVLSFIDGNLIVQSEGESFLELALLDMSGKLIYRRKTGRSSKAVLGLSVLPKGVYLVNATMSNGRLITSRFSNF